MIHLETNLLIGAEDETDAHHLTARLALARRDFFGCSAVVWMELHSRPAPTPLLRHAMESLLTGGILSFDVKTAELAGELFYSTGSTPSLPPRPSSPAQNSPPPIPPISKSLSLMGCSCIYSNEFPFT
jgi:hypothetical protein